MSILRVKEEDYRRPFRLQSGSKIMIKGEKANLVCGMYKLHAAEKQPMSSYESHSEATGQLMGLTIPTGQLLTGLCHTSYLIATQVSSPSRWHSSYWICIHTL